MHHLISVGEVCFFSRHSTLDVSSDGMGGLFDDGVELVVLNVFLERVVQSKRLITKGIVKLITGMDPGLGHRGYPLLEVVIQALQLTVVINWLRPRLLRNHCRLGNVRGRGRRGSV